MMGGQIFGIDLPISESFKSCGGKYEACEAQVGS
jgi:hypothetical protein